MPIESRYPIEICTDCLFLIANGTIGDHDDRPWQVEPDSDGTHIYNRPEDDQDENPDSRHAALMEAQWPTSDGWNIYLGDHETEFSASPCDGCGSRLGGSRHEAMAIREARLI